MIISNEEFASYTDKLKNNLKISRFEHSLGVSMTAACLAMRYGEDVYEARLAGLLHDCAKNLTDEELISFCSSNDIELSDEEVHSPKVIHAIAGPVLAMNLYGVENTNILNAIRYHSTGKANMNLLEKIIFTADYIEPNRKMIPGLREIRETAFVNLDKCVYMILHDTVNYLNATDSHIVSDTLKAYEYYKEGYNHG